MTQQDTYRTPRRNVEVAHTTQPVVATQKQRDSYALLTIEEVADALRVDPTTVRRWIKRGILDAVKLPQVGGNTSYRIKRQTLNRVLGK